MLHHGATARPWHQWRHFDDEETTVPNGDRVELGLFGINTSACAEPRAMARVAAACEAAGFDSVWTGEHVVLPDPQVPPSPVPPEQPMLDPAVALTWVAAHTERLLLGTGIIIVPQRNPLVLAKEMASVDRLSGGRLLLGVGVGYLEPEFAALGISMDDRGGRTEDHVAAMRAIWAGSDFDGPYTRFAGVTAHPRPVRPGGPPIVMAGHTAAAFRRAVTTSHGWYGFALDVPAAEACLAGSGPGGGALRAAGRARAAWRSRSRPDVRLDDESVAGYTALGVDRLIPMFDPASDVDGIVAMVEDLGRRYCS